MSELFLIVEVLNTLAKLVDVGQNLDHFGVVVPNLVLVLEFKLLGNLIEILKTRGGVVF